jgi:hypothetical protein
MTRNVGAGDMWVRMLIGIVLLLVSLFALTDPLWRVIAAIGAVMAVGTAIIHFCPLYRVFGMTTCKSAQK